MYNPDVDLFLCLLMFVVVHLENRRGWGHVHSDIAKIVSCTRRHHPAIKKLPSKPLSSRHERILCVSTVTIGHSVPNDSDAWILVNVQQIGYFRVLYDDDNWHALIRQLNKDLTVSWLPSHTTNNLSVTQM